MKAVSRSYVVTEDSGAASQSFCSTEMFKLQTGENVADRSRLTITCNVGQIFNPIWSYLIRCSLDSVYVQFKALSVDSNTIKSLHEDAGIERLSQ